MVWKNASCPPAAIIKYERMNKMAELTMKELRKCLIAKLAEKEDALLILSAVSGIPTDRIVAFVKKGEIAFGDFIILKSLA